MKHLNLAEASSPLLNRPGILGKWSRRYHFERSGSVYGDSALHKEFCPEHLQPITEVAETVDPLRVQPPLVALLRMSEEVLAQGLLPPEQLVAEGALEVLLSCVSAPVRFEG